MSPFAWALVIVAWSASGAPVEFVQARFSTLEACQDAIVADRARGDYGNSADFFCLDAKYYPEPEAKTE